jgi:hypothetical protein
MYMLLIIWSTQQLAPVFLPQCWSFVLVDGDAELANAAIGSQSSLCFFFFVFSSLSLLRLGAAAFVCSLSH